MTKKEFLSEKDLAKLAKQFRKKSERSRPEAARELGLSHTSVFNAEETPSQSLSKVRKRIIQKYSNFKVIGPVFLLRPK